MKDIRCDEHDCRRVSGIELSTPWREVSRKAALVIIRAPMLGMRKWDHTNEKEFGNSPMITITSVKRNWFF